MRMRYCKISEVPKQVGLSKCLCCSLQRACEVEYNSDNEKRQGIAVAYLIPCAFKGHYKVRCSGHNWDDYPNATHNSHRLQPPRYGTKHEVMRSDQGIKQDLRPIGQYSQTVRVNRTVQLLRKVIIYDT